MTYPDRCNTSPSFWRAWPTRARASVSGSAWAALALAFSAAGLVRYVRHGLPERFPAPLGVDCPALLRHRPADGALPRPVPSARRKILAARGMVCGGRCARLGGASLYYLAGSNLALFTLAGSRDCSRVEPRRFMAVESGRSSPLSGAVSWLIVLLALLWFVTRLAGRSVCRRSAQTISRISI